MSDRAVSNLQMELDSANRDLVRLQALLADACAQLMQRFASASASLRQQPPQVDHAREELRRAISALQFEDMAQQLVAHTQGILARSSECVSNTPAGMPAGRPSPVAQSGIASGSIDLF